MAKPSSIQWPHCLCCSLGACLSCRCKITSDAALVLWYTSHTGTICDHLADPNQACNMILRSRRRICQSRRSERKVWLADSSPSMGTEALEHTTVARHAPEEANMCKRKGTCMCKRKGTCMCKRKGTCMCNHVWIEDLVMNYAEQSCHSGTG
jgi:hypothetical protein